MCILCNEFLQAQRYDFRCSRMVHPSKTEYNSSEYVKTHDRVCAWQHSQVHDDAVGVFMKQ